MASEGADRIFASATALLVCLATVLPGVALLATLPLWVGAMRLCGMSRDRAAREVVWLYGRIWTDTLALALPFKGRNGDPEGIQSPCILVSNHQSFFDVYCLGAQPLRDVVFVVGGWPFRMPLYRTVMRMAGYLNSEALAPAELLDRCKDLLGRGASIHFFPEGSRSRDGTPGRFKSGAFRLAVETGVPVVPFCIAGTGGLLAAGRVVPAYAPLAVRTLPPVDPVPYRKSPTGHLAMARDVRGLMVRALADMREER